METTYSDPRGIVFTAADRVMQDSDSTFGLSDHVMIIPTELVIAIRWTDRAITPRDPARYEALRADVQKHGIGNPLAVFHDKRRVCLAEGEHRIAVAVSVGLTEIPVRVIRLASLNEVSRFMKHSHPIRAALRPYLTAPT